MKAVDIMVRDVVTAAPQDQVGSVVKMLFEKDISAVPVVDSERHVIGIVSEADLMRREELGTARHRAWWLEALTPGATLAGEFAKSHGRLVSEVMTTDVVAATEDTPLDEIAGLFERHRIKRVPILREGRLVGIVSRSNLIQALASLKMTAGEAPDADRQIRTVLLEQLGQQSWTDFGSRNVTVSDGVVHMWGLVGSPAERKALVALAENVSGVQRVSDEMIPAY